MQHARDEGRENILFCYYVHDKRCQRSSGGSIFSFPALTSERTLPSAALSLHFHARFFKVPSHLISSLRMATTHYSCVAFYCRIQGGGLQLIVRSEGSCLHDLNKGKKGMVAFFASESVFFGLQVSTVEEVSRHYGAGFFFHSATLLSRCRKNLFLYYSFASWCMKRERDGASFIWYSFQRKHFFFGNR